MVTAAANAGLQKGDVLAAAGDRRVHGQTDFRGVLHRAPRGEADVVVRWWRGAEFHEATLTLKEGWRATRNGWRKSVAEADIGAPLWGRYVQALSPLTGSKATNSPT